MKNSYNLVNSPKNKKQDDPAKNPHPTDLYITAPSDTDLEAHHNQAHEAKTHSKGLLLKPIHKIQRPLDRVSVAKDVPVIRAMKNKVYIHPPPLQHGRDAINLSISESENEVDLFTPRFGNLQYSNADRIDGTRFHKNNRAYSGRDDLRTNQRYTARLEASTAKKLLNAYPYQNSPGNNQPARTLSPQAIPNQASTSRVTPPAIGATLDLPQSIIKPKPIVDKNISGRVYQPRDRSKQPKSFRFGKGGNKNNNNSYLPRRRILPWELPRKQKLRPIKNNKHMLPSKCYKFDFKMFKSKRFNCSTDTQDDFCYLPRKKKKVLDQMKTRKKRCTGLQEIKNYTNIKLLELCKLHGIKIETISNRVIKYRLQTKLFDMMNNYYVQSTQDEHLQVILKLVDKIRIADLKHEFMSRNIRVRQINANNRLSYVNKLKNLLIREYKACKSVLPEYVDSSDTTDKAVKMAEKCEMSNSKLRESLIELGETPGPITDSTKKVYMSRLEKLRCNTQKADEVEHVEKPEDESTPKKQPVRSSPRRKPTAAGVSLQEPPNEISAESSGDEQFHGTGFTVQRKPGDPEISYTEAMKLFEKSHTYTDIVDRAESTRAEPFDADCRLDKPASKADTGDSSSTSSCCSMGVCSRVCSLVAFLVKLALLTVLLGAATLLAVACYEDDLRTVVPEEVMSAAVQFKATLFTALEQMKPSQEAEQTKSAEL